VINILKASAGTGKTYRLSLEYLAALLRGEDFEEIVVMTFTRKATAEIRERVLAHIEDILEREEKSEVFDSLKEIYEGFELDLNLLREVYQRMLENKDKVRIYTIDSFINNIFKKAIAPYLDIYTYEIIEDDQNTETIEGIFKEILDNREYFTLMEKFLKDNTERDVDNYIGLIKNLIDERWKFLLIKPSNRSARAVGNLVSLFEQCLDTLEEIAIDRGKELSPAFLKKDFKDYLNLSSVEDKEEYIIRNYKVFIKNEFWNGSKTRAKAVAELLEELRGSYEVFRENLASYIYNTEMISYEQEVFNFSKMIFAIYDKIKFKEKDFTHSDISNYTYQYFYQEELTLLEDKVVSDYFFELIGTEVKTLFIDEFQDTSVLQWKILKPLIDKCQHVIAVGDEKQSIYGWRGGEKKLFAKLDQILDGTSESLSTCYRSEKEIISFVNPFFKGIYDNWYYEDVKHLAKKDGGYVQMLLGGNSLLINTETKGFQKLSKTEQQQALEFNDKVIVNLKEEIAESIQEKLVNYQKIAILARGNNDLAEIARELDKLDIPYILESKDSLIDHQAVKPIYALLSYLLYNDYFQLLRFLRSDLINLNNQGLKYLLRNKELVKGYLRGEESTIELSDLGQLLAEIRGLKLLDFNKLSNYLIEGCGLLDTYQGNTGALKNLYSFFELMKDFNYLKEFMDYLGENEDSQELKQVGAKESNAVKLMTIHKSKGLSFETEFFYWKPSSSRGNNGDQLEVYLNFDDKFKHVEDYLLSNSKYNSLFEYLGYDFYQQAQEKEFVEEINNIYVALTRPERNLFIYLEAPCKFNEKNNENDYWKDKSYKLYEDAILAGMRVNSLQELIEAKSIGVLSQARVAEEKKNIKVAKLRDYFALVEDIVEEDNELDKDLDLNKELKRVEGLAIHYYLEHIKYNTTVEKEYAQSMVLAKYGNMLGGAKIVDLFKRVDDFISSHCEYFAEKWEVFTEYELEANHQLHRIDRLMVDRANKEIMILDYKSGDTKQESQLERYQRIIRKKLGREYEIKAEFLEL
jgi:ATP-dependent exoDNAse (exonuclease V) beta subunit